MKVFISWSGAKSGAVAKALRDWLPNVIQRLEPWLSAADINPGARWNAEIAAQLDQTSVGVICLTPESLRYHWVSFEAGALAKTLQEKSLVIPYLLDLKGSDVQYPLAQFHWVSASEEGTRRVVETLNGAMPEGQRLSESRLRTAFDHYWPDLKPQLEDIAAQDSEVQPPAPRSTEELLEEILTRMRTLPTEAEIDTMIGRMLPSMIRLASMPLPTDPGQSQPTLTLATGATARPVQALQARARIGPSQLDPAVPTGVTSANLPGLGLNLTQATRGNGTTLLADGPNAAPTVSTEDGGSSE
jgi:hypothetical protein